MQTHLGRRVKQERQRLGLTQGALAKQVGLSLTGLHDIETGKTPDPRGSRILALAQAFGVSTDYLFGRRATPEAPCRPRRRTAA